MRVELTTTALYLQLVSKEEPELLDRALETILIKGGYRASKLSSSRLKVEWNLGDMGDTWADLHRLFKMADIKVTSVVHAEKVDSVPRPCRQWTPF